VEVGWLGNYVRSAYGCVMEGGCWWRRSGQREHEMGKRLLCRRDGRWGGRRMQLPRPSLKQDRAAYSQSPGRKVRQ
jgi:hypothetical protein